MAQKIPFFELFTDFSPDFDLRVPLNAAMVMYTPDDFRGRVFGLFNTAQQFGNMVGPLVSSAISMMAGIWEVYAIAGLIQLSLGVKVYLGRVRKGELGK